MKRVGHQRKWHYFGALIVSLAFYFRPLDAVSRARRTVLARHDALISCAIYNYDDIRAMTMQLTHRRDMKQSLTNNRSGRLTSWRRYMARSNDFILPLD